MRRRALQGFGPVSAASLEAIVGALGGSAVPYEDRTSARQVVEGRIHTSTSHPPDQRIALHNENSYSDRWPLRICFGCAIAAATGGATPLADSRRVLARIDAGIRAEFAGNK